MSQNLGGRPKGTNAEVLAARRILSGLKDLKEKFQTEHLLAAFQKILDTMNDPAANTATQRACANDIIKLYFQLHEDSLQVEAQFQESRKKRGAGKKGQEQEASDGEEESAAPQKSGAILRLKIK